jgi:hypothetical protein
MPVMKSQLLWAEEEDFNILLVIIQQYINISLRNFFHKKLMEHPSF